MVITISILIEERRLLISRKISCFISDHQKGSSICSLATSSKTITSKMIIDSWYVPLSCSVAPIESEFYRTFLRVRMQPLPLYTCL